MNAPVLSVSETLMTGDAVSGTVGLSPAVQEAVSHGARVVGLEENTAPGAGESPPLHWVYPIYVNSDKATVPHHHYFVDSPEGLAPLREFVREVRQMKEFEEYRETLGHRRVVVVSLNDPELMKIVKSSDASRYFEKGRKRIKAKIFKQLGRWRNSSGILLTLTFDPDNISCAEAWKQVGKLRSDFIDLVNHWRKRHGMPKAKYLSVLEEQPGTRYPHIHMIFPKLKYLAPLDEMTKWWGQASNSVDLSYKDSFSPTSYVLKYVTKLEGWSDLALSHIWKNRTRLYSLARDFKLPDYSDTRVPEWAFLKSGNEGDILQCMPLYRVAFRTILSDGVEYGTSG